MNLLENPPQARDFMTAHVHTVSPEMSLEEVVKFLVEHKISNAPVVEIHESRKILVGFISEADCLDHLSNEMFFGSPAPLRNVRSMMKLHPVCVTPDTNIFTLASIFVHHRLRHLPVVEGDRLIGIVSRRDVLKALDKLYRKAIKTSNAERFPPNLREIINHRFIVSGR